jgi:hypothetical protein
MPEQVPFICEGSTGPIIAVLLQALKTYGAQMNWRTFSKIRVDGIYGVMGSGCIVEFKNFLGISEETGIGPKTQEALLFYLGFDFAEVAAYSKILGTSSLVQPDGSVVTC